MLLDSQIFVEEGKQQEGYAQGVGQASHLTRIKEEWDFKTSPTCMYIALVVK